MWRGASQRFRRAWRKERRYALDNICCRAHTDFVVDVILTDEALAWYGTLDDADRQAMDRVIDALEREGVNLGYPHSSKIKIAKKYNMRELRASSRGRELRALYVFDPKRQAVVLSGGDKTGMTGRFYEQLVAFAEKVYEQYLVEQSRGDHDKKKK